VGLVGEVVLDSVAGEDQDADWQGFEHGIVALEGRGLGMCGPVGTECDLRDVSVPAMGDVLAMMRRTAFRLS
jgi:hypothetical protein